MTAAKTAAPTLPALDPLAVSARQGSGYPDPFHKTAAGREKRALGDAAGLTRYGVNLVHLPPGAWSSQRHWHSHEEEFVYVLEGELWLVTEGREQRLAAGMAAGFPAGKPDGHHLVNRSERAAVYLEIGDRRPEDECHYPDIDLHLKVDAADNPVWSHKDGRPY